MKTHTSILTDIPEKFIGLESKVDDFWRWALSDWTSATTRALLAEYYVRCAIGQENEPAPEWEYADIRMMDGTTIEVKCSSFLQPPIGSDPTSPKFDIGKRQWAWDSGKWGWMDSKEPKRWADCYVFCIQNSKDWYAYNPLDISQWDFYVLSTSTVDKIFNDQKTVSLNRLVQEDFKPVKFKILKAKIDKVKKRVVRENFNNH